jgi:uncharacterized protein YdaU (DUF1376 family)
MPWYIGDYLRKTMHLDADEDGAYRRLIDATWVAGGLLVASDKEMAQITKLPLKKWLAVKATVAKFFTITEEGWRHGRVSEELAKAEAIVSARSAGGKRTAEKRWGNKEANSSDVAEQPTETIAQQVAELPLSGLQSGRPSPSPSPSPRETDSRPAARKRATLSASEREEFDSWYEHYPRKEDRGHAEIAFLKARKIASLEELIEGVKRYAKTIAAERTERRYIALPATWLNGERWADEPGGTNGKRPLPAFRSPRSPAPVFPQEPDGPDEIQ